MKSFLKVTALSSAFAVCNLLPSFAQTAIQETFHMRQVNPCFQTPEPAEQYLNNETQQRLLFISQTQLYLTIDRNQELTMPAYLSMYLDSNSLTYTIIATFDDGVTCLVAEGYNLEIYATP